MSKYKLADFYEDYELVGCYDQLDEARHAAESYREETDGECDLVLFYWNDDYQAYAPETLYPSDTTALITGLA